MFLKVVSPISPLSPMSPKVASPMSPMSPGHVSAPYLCKKDIGDIGDMSSPPLDMYGANMSTLLTYVLGYLKKLE